MRVGIIAPPWAPIPPKLYGGIEAVVDTLATGIARAGHDVLLFTTGDSTCGVPMASVLLEAEGHRMGNITVELRHVYGAYEAMAAFEPHVIHDHSVLGPLVGINSQPALAGTKVVTTVHGAFDDELRAVYEQSARHSSLVAISHAQRKPVPDIPIARVIHHGVDANDFPFGAGDGGYFLFLGRMSPDKGAHRAMEAASKAGVPLLMCAKMREPAEVAYFEQFVRPHLNDDLRYLGEVPHEQKLELLSGARGLLFPIRWNEPFGMVMIEALACGTPVLAFPEGAAPEVVEHGRTGYLCHDVSDMAEAIARVGDIDRDACRGATLGYFSSDRMVREHIDLFDSLVR